MKSNIEPQPSNIPYHPCWRYILHCLVRDLRDLARNLYRYGRP